jgi:hypothetical protein
VSREGIDKLWMSFWADHQFWVFLPGGVFLIFVLVRGMGATPFWCHSVAPGCQETMWSNSGQAEAENPAKMLGYELCWIS